MSGERRAGAPFGVALIGYGLAGKVFHGMLVRATPGLEVRAIVTRDPERRAQAQADFPEARLYDRFEEVLADPRVDLVVIGTPHDTHAPMAIAAAQAGKHVVVDKIMCLSTAEADAMIAAARQHGVVLSVFHNRRWDSDFLTVRRALEAGWLGEPYVFESCVVGHRRPPTGPPERLPWRMRAVHGGGPFRDWGAHLVDQAVQLFGTDIDSVYADFQYRFPGVDVETAAFCEIRFRNGVRYRIEVGSISHIGRPRWYVRGSQGALRIEGLDPQEAALKRGEVTAGRAYMPAENCLLVSEVPGAQLQIVPGDYLAYYQNIAAALAGEAELAVRPESVRDALAVMELAIRSAQLGRSLRPGE